MRYKDPKFRLQVYECMLEVLKTNISWHIGFCYSIDVVITKLVKSFDREYILNHKCLCDYIELYKHKPVSNTEQIWWFDSRNKQIRIDILNKAIEEVKQLINE